MPGRCLRRLGCAKLLAGLEMRRVARRLAADIAVHRVGSRGNSAGVCRIHESPSRGLPGECGSQIGAAHGHSAGHDFRVIEDPISASASPEWCVA